jgi:phosphoglycolate phosphatase-like HAD superfamily hydrolase/N-acetylglutamate synthase-like GNAT family acetyltransferase
MRAVLFDMDGVLVRSEEVWFRVVEAAGVRFRGRPVTREEFFPTFGQGTAADLPVFGFSCTVAELDAFYVSEFLQHLGSMWVNPEAGPLAQTLVSRGLRIGLVTNTVAPLTKAILEHAGLATWFEVRATADRVVRAKPAPDLVQLALSELNVPAPEAVMVGDSRFDRDAAGAAKVRFLGLKLDGDDRLERLGDLPGVLGLEQAPWRLRPAQAVNRAAIEALLTKTGLPLDGLSDQFPSAYVVAVAADGLVGVAGLEQHGRDGLLRSVAVVPSLRRTGLGSALVDERLAEARKRGLERVSLLTTTAGAWFSRRGFAERPRDAASNELRASVEFASACPSTAAHLVWTP